MTTRLLVGDCRVTLPTLAAGSVQSVITSPPYYGLRDYGTPPLVWGGDAAHEHEWAAATRFSESSVRDSGRAGLGSQERSRWINSGFCPCGAWLGNLGLEPTPELYVEHLVEVFRHVWRVLADSGTVWLNLGDSYAGSGKGPSNSLNKSNPHSHEASKAMKRGLNNLQDTPTAWMPLQRVGPQEHTIGHGRVPGLKPKDLMMMPARVAIALQADGWTLRQQLPWLKRNCMPGSEKDRPTTAVEYWFLLSKSRRYYWDYGAVRIESRRRSSGNKKRSIAITGERSRTNTHLGSSVPWENDGNGRNWRNSDPFFESWQGLLADEDGEPLALVVNPRPLKLAHFAVFPPKLIEPMIKASTRPGDVVLDPFGGSGTVGLVADRLGRDSILCELSDKYTPMAAERLTNDGPMFAEVEVA